MPEASPGAASLPPIDALPDPHTRVDLPAPAFEPWVEPGAAPEPHVDAGVDIGATLAAELGFDLPPAP